jgi:hypothetical protein
MHTSNIRPSSVVTVCGSSPDNGIMTVPKCAPPKDATSGWSRPWPERAASRWPISRLPGAASQCLGAANFRCNGNSLPAMHNELAEEIENGASSNVRDSLSCAQDRLLKGQWWRKANISSESWTQAPGCRISESPVLVNRTRKVAFPPVCLTLPASYIPHGKRNPKAAMVALPPRFRP